MTEQGVDRRQDDLLSGLDKVEKIASASKLRRFFMNPLKYKQAVFYRQLQYRWTGREKEVVTETFFGGKMNLLLPSGTDIYLTGGKSHNSEIRLGRYLINNLTESTVFLDIGAHYGYFSLLASLLVGESGSVISFEAAPSTFEILRRNLQGTPNAVANHRAVSDSDEMIKFYEFPNLYSEYNSLDSDQFKENSWFGRNVPTEVRVKGVVLDDWTEKNRLIPDFIKIDVEGAEYKVLSGAQKLLRENSPKIVMEYLSEGRGNQPHIRANELLRSLCYRPHVISDTGHTAEVTDLAGYLKQSGLESDNVVFEKIGV